MAGTDTYVIRRTYTATIASKGIYINTGGKPLGPITEWFTNTSYSVGDLIVTVEGVFQCVKDHVSTKFQWDLENWINLYVIANSLIDDSQISTSLTWSSSKIVSFLQTYKVFTGQITTRGFNNGTEAVFHNCGKKPSFVSVTPADNTSGTLGEYWVYADNSYIRVGNTGDSGIVMNWVAIA